MRPYGPATASGAARARSSPFGAKPYGTLGWPMRPGDWLPELEPLDPAFENYYPQNYEAAEGGMFVGLKPLGDLDAKTNRAAAALSKRAVPSSKAAGHMRQARLPSSSRLTD